MTNCECHANFWDVAPTLGFFLFLGFGVWVVAKYVLNDPNEAAMTRERQVAELREYMKEKKS